MSRPIEVTTRSLSRGAITAFAALALPIGAGAQGPRECDPDCIAVIEAGITWFTANSGIPASELVLDELWSGTVPARLPMQARERPLQGSRLNLLRQRIGLLPGPAQREDLLECNRDRLIRGEPYCYLNSGRGFISFDFPDITDQEATLRLRFTVGCAEPVEDGRFPKTGGGAYVLKLGHMEGQWSVTDAHKDMSEGDFHCRSGLS